VKGATIYSPKGQVGVKVIGAGFGRTGTASLKVALEELGFGPCYHMTEVFANPEHADFWRAAWRGEPVSWEGVLGSYEATVDWPACTFYEQLMERHPDAKVLLSVRDPEQWYESTRSTIYELGKISTGSPLARLSFSLLSLFVFGTFKTGQGPMTEEIVWQGTFDGRFEDKHHAIGVFNRHNEEVQRRVPQEQLLVYEVKKGWGPLCEFLGVEEPEEPFPRLNDAAEMRRRIVGVRAATLAVPAVLVLLVMAVLVLLGRHARA
jgi:Sulfotransferase domain